MHVMVSSITITHTGRGGWVWLSSSSQRGSISEKDDQWGSQPASYGGLKTFHDLRDPRARSNQLYSVEVSPHFTLNCNSSLPSFFENPPAPYLLTGYHLQKLSGSSQFELSSARLIKEEQKGNPVWLQLRTLEFLLPTKVSGFWWDWKGPHLLQHQDRHQGKKEQGGWGPYACAHMVPPRTTVMLPKTLHLHSILPSLSILPHSSSPSSTPPASYTPSLLSSMAVVILGVDFSLSFLASPPFREPSPLFLSLSNYVRCREWIDPGSVFIGSVISTACSHAPLRGWGMGEHGSSERRE